MEFKTWSLKFHVLFLKLGTHRVGEQPLISSAYYQCKHSLFINFQSLHSVERFEQISTLSKSLLWVYTHTYLLWIGNYLTRQVYKTQYYCMIQPAGSSMTMVTSSSLQHAECSRHTVRQLIQGRINSYQFTTLPYPLFILGIVLPFCP